eukprot:c26299_g1_i2 orf=1174-2790(-)
MNARSWNCLKPQNRIVEPVGTASETDVHNDFGVQCATEDTAAVPSTPRTDFDNQRSFLGIAYSPGRISGQESRTHFPAQTGIAQYSRFQAYPSPLRPRSPLSFPFPYCTESPEPPLQSPYSRSSDTAFARFPYTRRYLSPSPIQSPNSHFSTYGYESSPSWSPYPDYIERVIRQSSRFYRCIATVDGHQGHVAAVAPAGNLLYSASQKSEILVSRKPLFLEYARFGQGSGSVKALIVTDDKVYSAHQDCKIRVWHRQSRRQLKHKLFATLPTFKDYLFNFIPHKNYVQIRRHHKRLWIEHVDTITALALDQNRLLYSSSWDKTVKVWRLSDLKCIESIQAHDDAVNAVAVGTDGILYTGSGDSTVKVWAKVPTMDRHDLIQTLDGHESTINALALSSDEQILYTGSSDRSIKVWQKKGLSRYMTYGASLCGHRQAVLCLGVAGNLLCSGSADKRIHVWKRYSGAMHSCLAVLEGHAGPVKCLSVSLDARAGCLIYSGSMDCTLKVWRIFLEQEEDLSSSREATTSAEPSPQFISQKTQ